jgi:hypothetical protein
MTKQTTLERRIGAVLTDDYTKSSVIAALIAETETAIVAADEDAKLEQERVFDPLASPDPKAAREAMQAAEFMQTWLRSALLRLQRRLRETQERERRAKWYAEYEALKSKRDALAAEFREVYPEFEAKVVGLLNRMAANDAEISNLHIARSAGVKLHLLEAELVARGLEQFTRDMPSITKELKLPAFEPGQPLAWPRRLQSHSTWFAPMPYDPRFTARWGEVGERQRREQERQPAAIKSNLSPPPGATITAPPPAAMRAESTTVGSSLNASRSIRHRKPKPMQIRTTPSAVVASPSSPTAMPHPEPKPKEVIATDSAPLAAYSESVLATATSGPRGAETNANTTPSTGGMLGPEYLPGDVGDSVADNLTDDQKNGTD